MGNKDEVNVYVLKFEEGLIYSSDVLLDVLTSGFHSVKQTYVWYKVVFTTKSYLYKTSNFSSNVISFKSYYL
jgi:hypothetical protein